jgi:hypothetical protein
MISSQVELLLIGAAIALLSSLVTTVVSSILSHFLQRKIKHEERITRLHFLVGKVSSKFCKKDDDDLVKIWREQKALTENFVNAVLK